MHTRGFAAAVLIMAALLSAMVADTYATYVYVPTTDPGAFTRGSYLLRFDVETCTDDLSCGDVVLPRTPANAFPNSADSIEGMAFGPDAALYISYASYSRADAQLAQEIRRCDDTCLHRTDPANAASAFTGPLDFSGPIVFGPDKHLYTIVPGGNWVKRLGINWNTPDSPTLDPSHDSDFVSAGSGGLHDTSAIAFDPDGDLYVASVSTDWEYVRRYDRLTGAFKGVFVSDFAHRGQNITAMAFGRTGDAVSGKLYLFVAWGAGYIVRYDGNTGNFVDIFVNGPAGGNVMGSPTAFTWGPDNNLYVAGRLVTIWSWSGTDDGATAQYVGSLGIPSCGVWYDPCINQSHGIAFQPTASSSAPPDTQLTATPPAVTRATDASFSFEATRPATFECRLDGSAFEACVAPRVYAALADGLHTFDVHAKATAGGTNGTPASYTWRVDTAKPTLSIPGSVPATATSTAGAIVAYSVSAVDPEPSSGIELVACVPAASTVFAPGQTTVVCSATDLADNATTASFPVNVTFSWSNVQRPINLDGSSTFKLGSTVRAQFQLTGDSTPITDLVARLYIAKVNDGIVGTELEAASTAAADSGNTFRYDPLAGKYGFNLGTKGLSAGTWQLRIDLGDGTTNTVVFSLRK